MKNSRPADDIIVIRRTEEIVTNVAWRGEGQWRPSPLHSLLTIRPGLTLVTVRLGACASHNEDTTEEK